MRVAGFSAIAFVLLIFLFLLREGVPAFFEVPLGNLEEMAPWPVSRLIKGAPNIGGPSVTAGGLTFIASTPDYYLRAFDSETGEELWKAKLPIVAIVVLLAVLLCASR